MPLLSVHLARLNGVFAPKTALQHYILVVQVAMMHSRYHLFVVCAGIKIMRKFNDSTGLCIRHMLYKDNNRHY